MAFSPSVWLRRRWGAGRISARLAVLSRGSSTQFWHSLKLVGKARVNSQRRWAGILRQGAEIGAQALRCLAGKQRLDRRVTVFPGRQCRNQRRPASRAQNEAAVAPIGLVHLDPNKAAAF